MDTPGRVTATTVAAVLVYPLQIAHGALPAIAAGSASIPGFHFDFRFDFRLTTFGVLTLAWQMESETGGADGSLHSEEMDASILNQFERDIDRKTSRTKTDR